MPFTPIVAEKVSAAVARQIETLILQGVLRPGERLPAERELAQRLDVSRPTLREALADLEARGLVLIRPGGGAFVAEVLGSAFAPALIELFATHDLALFDYLDFRRDIEGLAAAQAAERATAADRERLNAVFARMERAHRLRDPAEEAEIDADFHMCVIEAAHNVVMLHMMRSLYELLRRGVFYNRSVAYAASDSRDRLLEQHRVIRDAVIAGEPEAARAAVKAHLDFVQLRLRDGDRVRAREEIAALRQEQEKRISAPARRRREA